LICAGPPNPTCRIRGDEKIIPLDANPKSRARDPELPAPPVWSSPCAPRSSGSADPRRREQSAVTPTSGQSREARRAAPRPRDREAGHRAGSSCVQTEPPSTCARPGLVPAALLRSGARFPEMREAPERLRPPNEYQVLHPGDPLASLCRPPVYRTPPGRQKDMSHPRLACVLLGKRSVKRESTKSGG
jgi:hypothetical protein